MQKYFLQILAGISNAEIVLDPQGYLVPGTGQVIPFPITEADYGTDVILLTPYPQYVNFRLRPPTTAQIIDPATAAAQPNIEFVRSSSVSYYRMGLPLDLIPRRFDQGGTWQALLDIGRPGAAAGVPSTRDQAATLNQFSSAVGGQRGLPFSVVVHAYSNLNFRVNSSQSGYEPGATVQLNATIAESGVPLLGYASVWAEVTTPSRLCIACQPHAIRPRHLRRLVRCHRTGHLPLARPRLGNQPPRLAVPPRTDAHQRSLDRRQQPDRGKDGGLCHLLHCLFGQKA